MITSLRSRTTFITASLLLLSQIKSTSAAYSLYRDYSGSTFFDQWTFFGHYDNLTNGDVIWVNQSASSELAYVNDAGRVIIKVDNTTNVPVNDKRDSVRITTEDYFGIGSLFVFDAYHLPYGCSVWPAFWAVGPDWPSNGEIDIFEGGECWMPLEGAEKQEDVIADTTITFANLTVNQQQSNQFAIHTGPGCTLPTNTSSIMTGSPTYTDCSTTANQNAGCGVVDPQASSYGSAFAAAGGGVFATEYAASGIRIWFWNRASIPSDLLASNTSAKPDPNGWGEPAAFFPNSSSCEIEQYFGPQQLVLDITLCGDWAGQAAVYSQTCTLQQSCYLDNVPGNGSNYDNAYFEIGSVRVYNDGSAQSTSTSAHSIASSTATSTSSRASPSATGSGGSSAAATYSSATATSSKSILAFGLSIAMIAIGYAL